MPADRVLVSIADTLKAVGYALGIPPGELVGYVVIGVRTDGSKDMTANLKDPIDIIGVMADAITDLIVELRSGGIVITPG